MAVSLEEIVNQLNYMATVLNEIQRAQTWGSGLGLLPGGTVGLGYAPTSVPFVTTLPAMPAPAAGYGNRPVRSGSGLPGGAKPSAVGTSGRSESGQ